MITHDDYTFTEHGAVDNGHWTVHLLTGDYKDVYVQYGTVRLIPPEGGTLDDDGATMQFKYDIIDLPTYLDKEDLESDEDFMNHLGDVLTHIINDSFDTGNYSMGEKGDSESGNNGTQESTE